MRGCDSWFVLRDFVVVSLSLSLSVALSAGDGLCKKADGWSISSKHSGSHYIILEGLNIWW